MMIDKVGGIGPNYGTRKSEPVAKEHSTVRGDNVLISEEATRAADLARTVKTVNTSRDTERSEKLKEVKEKLARGDYDQLDDNQLGEIAESISNNLLGQA